jgi:thiol-disulfide isomerase/thioredoxin
MRTVKGFIALLGLVTGFAVAASAQSLASLDGSRVALDAQQGKVVILSYGASWLPLSGKQAEFANQLAKKYAGRNVAVYYVLTDSSNPRSKNFASAEALQKWSFDNKVSVPVLIDADGAATFRKYRIEQVPSFIIIDRNGVLSGDPIGGIETSSTPGNDAVTRISRVVDRLL